MATARFILPAILIASWGAFVSNAEAGSNPEWKATVTLREAAPLAKGAVEVGTIAGAFFSVDATTGVRPNFAYTVQSFRVGRILTGRIGSGLLAGNVKLLGEVFGGEILHVPGHGLGGATILLRYNFTQPGAALIPYVQLGAGGLYNDVYHNQEQSAIGSAFEFDLQAALGLRLMLNPHWSIIEEYGYRHISNAGFAYRNNGPDSLGGNFGFGILL